MLLLILSLMVLALLGASARTAPALAGLVLVVATHPKVYDVQIDLPGNQFSGILTVDPDDTPPAVTLQVGASEVSIMSANRTGDTLDLVTSHGGNLFVYKLVLEGEKIRGSVTYNGGELKGTVTGQRKR
ncbi:MAG: hypothetical protein ABI647_11645 [Gemmatimonadota bacterium]